jgi:hypothetical protein
MLKTKKTELALSTCKQAMQGGLPLKTIFALLINEGFSNEKTETIMRWSAMWLEQNVDVAWYKGDDYDGSE